MCSQSLGVHDIVFEELTRLGAKSKRGPGKHPLLRFKDTDEVKRNNILRSAFMLKNTKIQAHKKKGIGRDLTKKQRERNDELRSQLAKIKKDFPNRN